MAIIQINYLSKALFRTVPLNIYLPADKISFSTMDYCMRQGQTFKTLYLLHGLLGNYTDWLVGTRIQSYAEKKNLAVIMPSGDNSFYVNGLTPNNDYGTFIGEELIRITRNIFPLSDRREDTFIAGLSMGGFGALRNGIVYGDTFGYVAGMSSALQILDAAPDNVQRENEIFGDFSVASETDKNPRVALDMRIAAGKPLPKFYLACGLDDSLLEVNRNFHVLLQKKGAEVTWSERPGGHNWEYWDSEIRHLLDWLPLDSEGGSLGSGNVRVTEKSRGMEI